MVNLKNNHGLKVSLYVSDITGYPMVVTTIDFNWYDNNPSCSLTKLCEYQENMDITFSEKLERLEHEITPLSNDLVLEHMTARVLKAGFTYDFRKVVD